MKIAQKLLIIVSLLISSLVVLPKSVFASNLHLSPGGGNIAVGQTLAVQVKLNTAGQPVNGVTALLSYPTDKLDVAYVTPGSAFSIEAEKVVGGGNIRISRGNIGAVSGDVVVATIGFRGKALGAANVAFISGSGAPSSSSSSETLNLGASSGGNFTVVAANAQASIAPVAKGPVISNVQVAEVATSSATITWKTDKKSDSVVEYGVDRTQFVLSTAKSDSVTDHSVRLENLQFPAGTKLYFQVKSKDANNVQSVSEVGTIQLKGYKVVIKITDKKNNALANVKVTIYSEPQESATNDQGQVTFADNAPGRHVVLMQNGSLEKSEEIEIADNGNLDQTQDFNLIFDPANSTTARTGVNLNSKNTLAMIVLGLSLLILISVVVYVIRKRQGGGGTSSGQSESNPFPFFNSSGQNNTQQNPVVYHPGS